MVGGLAWFWPQMWGNGYSTVSWLLVSEPGWQLVLTLLVCKLVATAATSGSGAVGGIFTPMLFAGAAGGALAGQLLNLLLPGWLPVGGAVLVGMAAFLAATARAPWLAVLMLIASEMMLFSGLIGSFLIFRLSAPFWPPPALPRLPLTVT